MSNTAIKKIKKVQLKTIQDLDRIEEAASKLDNLVLLDYNERLCVSDISLLKVICADLDKEDFFMFFSLISQEDFNNRIVELCKIYCVNNKYELIYELRKRNILPAGLYTNNFRVKMTKAITKKEVNSINKIYLYKREVEVLRLIKAREIKKAEHLLTGFLQTFTIKKFMFYIKNKLDLRYESDIIPVLTTKGII